MIRSLKLINMITLSLLTLVALGVTTAHAMTSSMQSSKPVPLVQPGAPGKPTKTLSPQESVALGQSKYTPADVRFMQMMAIHHNQAVEMVALIDGRTTHEGIVTLGRRIASSQSAEIEMMHTWLKRRGHPISTGEEHSMMMDEASHKEGVHKKGKKDHDAHEGHKKKKNADDTPLMTGMLSLNQMRTLAASEKIVFDELFLTGMILHHQGALTMVNNLLKQPHAGEDPEISEFLASINADQTSEILRMQYFLSEL